MTAELGPIIFVFQNIRLFKTVKMLTAIKLRKGLCLRLIPETDPNEGNGGGSKGPPHLLAQLSTG